MTHSRRRAAPAPLLYDPFSGERVTVKGIKQGGSWVAATKRYFFGPFKTRGELFVAFSQRDGVPPAFAAGKAESLKAFTKSAGSSIAPAAKPLTNCPFTGKPVQIVPEDPQDRNGRWMIKGERYSIFGFPTELAAQYFFSTREGTTPNFSSTYVEVVRDEGDTPDAEFPDDPFEGTSHAEAENASKTLADQGFAGSNKQVTEAE